MVVRAGIFVLGSAAIVLLSRRSLGAPRSHGFYRFFAFELLLLLVLVNSPYWFRDPFSLRQMVSWFLLAVPAGLAVEGFRLLRRVGKPAGQAERLLAFENTTTLVTVGAYRFIRHPLYASLMAGAWGACLKEISAISAGLALGASGFLVAASLAEERENAARFGAAYAAYRKATRRFVPFLF